MSNFTRKIERTKKGKSSNMVYVVERYCYGIGGDIPHFVEVGSYNKEYFENSKELIEGYELFFNDYIEFLNQTNVNMRVIKFLEDSVENNYMLEDYLEEVDFNVVKDHIYVRDNDFINMGEFYIDIYQVNVSGSYMFFENLCSRDKKYMYYGD